MDSIFITLSPPPVDGGRTFFERVWSIASVPMFCKDPNILLAFAHELSIEEDSSG